jgi:hypothetical protein
MSNNAITANSISTTNAVANTDFYMLVRNPAANNWVLKIVAANNMGVTANIAVGSNTLHIVNGLIISIT